MEQQHQLIAPQIAEDDDEGSPPVKYPKGGPGRPLTLDRKRPYPCDICPSRFGSKMELEEHQNSHTGEKPFECEVCKARFNRRSTLWNHKRIHSDTKPFTCPVCNMTFKWKNSLKCHKEMHLRKNETTAIDLDNSGQITYASSTRGSLNLGGNPNPTAPQLLNNNNNNNGLHPEGNGGSPPKKKKKSSKAKGSANNQGVSVPMNNSPEHQRLLSNGGTASPGHLTPDIQVHPTNIMKSALIQYSEMSPSPGNGPNQSNSSGYSPPSDPAPTSVSIQNNQLVLNNHASPIGHLLPPHLLGNRAHHLQPTTSHQTHSSHSNLSFSHPEPSTQPHLHPQGPQHAQPQSQPQQQQQQQMAHQQPHQAPINPQQLNHTPSYPPQSVLHIVSPIGGMTPNSQNSATLPTALLTPNTTPNFFSPQGPSPTGPTPASVINGMRHMAQAPLVSYQQAVQTQQHSVLAHQGQQNMTMSGNGDGNGTTLSQMVGTTGNGTTTVTPFGLPGDYVPNVDFMLQQGLGPTPSSAMTMTATHNHHHHHHNVHQAPQHQAPIDGAYIVKVLPFTEW